LTYFPSRDDFKKLARDHSIVPVWREVVADLITPVAAFARLVGDGEGFLLESVEHERWSRFSFVGRNPSATLTARAGTLIVDGVIPATVPRDRGILAAIEQLLHEYRSPALADLPPLHGGLVGYLGYDVVREVERLPNVPPDDVGHPDAVMSVIGELAVFDHWRQRVTLIANVVIPATGTTQPAEADDTLDATYDDAIARVDRLAVDGARPLDEPLLEPPDADEPLPALTRTMSPQAFADAIAVAKEHIFAGDIFQVVLSQRFDVDLDAEPFDFYRALRQVNPSPYMYFIRCADLTVVG
jgi:anthranilate synthase component 1